MGPVFPDYLSVSYDYDAFDNKSGIYSTQQRVREAQFEAQFFKSRKK